MRQQSRSWPSVGRLGALTMAAVLASCTPSTEPASDSPPSFALGASGTVNVANVEELYQAVNDPQRADHTVVLAAGTYLLSANDQGGQPRPNRGTLRLQPGMLLRGAEVRADADGDQVPDEISPGVFTVSGATIIDGSQLVPPLLPRTSCDADGAFVNANIAEPVIQLSRESGLRDLTVLSGPNVAVSEPANAIEQNTNLIATITNTVLDGNLPIAFANSGCQTWGAPAHLTFERNVVRRASAAGLSVANLRTGAQGNATAGGPQLSASVRYNRFQDNVTGMAARGGAQGSDGGRVSIVLEENLFVNNGQNLFAMGGFAQTANSNTVGNALVLTSTRDRFGLPTGPVNITLYGARSASGTGVPQQNGLTATFNQSRLVAEAGRTTEFALQGLQQRTSGSLNTSLASLLGVTVTTATGQLANGTITLLGGPAGSDLSNQARLSGTRSAFLLNNPAFAQLAPVDSFFTDHPGTASIWLGLRNSDDVGTYFDLRVEVLRDGGTVGIVDTLGVRGGSSGFNNAILRAATAIYSQNFAPGQTLGLRLSVRIATTVPGHVSGTARLWYNEATTTGRTANSRFELPVGGVMRTYFLRPGAGSTAPVAGVLNTTAGTSRQFIDVTVNKNVNGNPFIPFGTWTVPL